MAGTYTKSKGGSVGAGVDSTYEFDAITIPDSEEFYRCKITNESSSYTGSCQMRGNAQTVFGGEWNEWSTNKKGINWSKSGDSPKVKVHNADTAKHAWTLKVWLETKNKTKYAISISSGTGGTVTANKASTYEGDTVTLTVTPAANYKLNALTVKKGSTAITVTNNKFTMPAGAVTVTATWTQTNLAITKVVSPAGAGTITGASSAVPGTSVTMSQTPASGYAFAGWSISSGTISAGGVFTMPSVAVTVTARYNKLSTGSVNKTTFTDGEHIILTIAPGSSAYSHKWRLYLPNDNNLDTGWVSAAAGVTSVNISIPQWADDVTTADRKTGMLMLLQTYSGSTLIGQVTVSNNLTYTVPAEAVPTVTAFTPAVERTIGGVAYANVGDVFTQNHCGVSVSTTAAGSMGSTITSMVLTMSGYSGSDYAKTVSGGSISFTSGLLHTAGTCRITVTATDSRGRTATATADITVVAYTNPGGSLNVWRVDEDGNDSDVGGYAKFEITKTFSPVGNNALTVTLSDGSTTATLAADTGDIMPGARKPMLNTLEYDMTLTLADRFETTVITARLPSARFVIYVDKDGDRIAFMKAANQAIPAGKDGTFEISDSLQMYYGSDTLEDYLLEPVSVSCQAGTNVTLNNLYLAKSGRLCVLHVKATITSGSTVAGTNGVILTLPDGFRPQSSIYFYAWGNYSVTGMTMSQLRIDSNGQIITRMGSGTFSGDILIDVVYAT